MNTAAINALGLNDPGYEPGGNIEVVRDNNGKATGLMKEGFDLIRKSVLKQTNIQTQKRRILAGLNACVKAGLTQVHACEGRVRFDIRTLCNILMFGLKI